MYTGWLVRTRSGGMRGQVDTIADRHFLCIYLFFLAWTDNIFFFSFFLFFLLNVFQKHPSIMISHIKNISMGLWLHKERKHIQYPNIYKLYVSCKFIMYTRTFGTVILIQRREQCKSLSSLVSTEWAVQSS